MTTHKNITRILAVLLAVLLFGQLAAFQIPAFAADVVPDVHDGAAYIPDDADVNDLLSQTLLSNYSDVGCQEWEYKATSTLSGGATKWVPVTGTTAGIIPALTAVKANVRVKVQAAAISAGETLTTQQYVTTNPEDTFAIFKVYSGVTSGLSGIVYVQLPESMVSETALKVLDPIVKPILGKTLTEALQNGTTVGELRTFLSEHKDLLDGAANVLKFFGVDVSAFTELVKTLSDLPSVFDSTRVAFGSPNRAGMYLVTAIASNPNYNPGVGTGVLVVKMHTSGASLSWNNSETTYAASALKADTLNATLMCGDSAAGNQDGVHYRYIGFTAAHKLYVSSKAPTEAGTYRQTAYIFGGNDMAKSISRTVTITAD